MLNKGEVIDGASMVRLLPNQVVNVWELLKEGIKEAFPPFLKLDEDKLNRILETLLAGDMTCWVSYNNLGQPHGFALANFIYDYPSQSKNLLLYVIWSKGDATDKVWADSYRPVLAYAKQEGCDKIVGYTNNKRMLEVARLVGARTEMTFVELEVR